MNKITIHKIAGEQTIPPELHGQFIEFLGGCISDGIWVGRRSAIPNEGGVRLAVLDAMERLRPPLLRWPGGCYADMYHWRDGVGNRRKTVWNANFTTWEAEDNGFGTHEFLEFCRAVGAKPWININMLRGTVAEMVDWAEYCNRAGDTALARERAANGSPEPFGVEYWGIGNECWGGGGTYTAQGYADDYRKYASAMPRFVGPGPDGRMAGPEMKLIASGPDGNKPRERVLWTRELLRELKRYRMPPIYGMDLHFYNWNREDGGLREDQFDREGWYRVLFGSMELEEVLREQAALMHEELDGYAPMDRDPFFVPPQLRLIVGEWGNWHGAAFRNAPSLYQQCTMRDALTTAISLDIFHRCSGIVSAACVAQTVNVLNALILTREEHTVLTPNYHVFEMYRPHRGGKVLPLELETDTAWQDGDARVPELYVFASEKDGTVTLNAVNACMEEARTAQLTLPEPMRPVSARVLRGADVHDCNTPEAPDRVAPADAAAPAGTDGRNWTLSLPAASVSVYQFVRT